MTFLSSLAVTMDAQFETVIVDFEINDERVSLVKCTAKNFCLLADLFVIYSKPRCQNDIINPMKSCSTKVMFLSHCCEGCRKRIVSYSKYYYVVFRANIFFEGKVFAMLVGNPVFRIQITPTRLLKGKEINSRVSNLFLLIPSRSGSKKYCFAYFWTWKPSLSRNFKSASIRDRVNRSKYRLLEFHLKCQSKL